MAQWTREQLIIAIEFYSQCPENRHTDSHRTCKRIARMLGRTPGALDRIIRNIKFVDTGGIGLSNASSRIHGLVGEFQSDPQRILDEAQTIRTSNGWGALNC